jgi:hypothetical protein
LPSQQLREKRICSQGNCLAEVSHDYLDREGYRVSGKRSPEQSQGTVQEHLEKHLEAGWEIKEITGGGWVVVLLEEF